MSAVDPARLSGIYGDVELGPIAYTMTDIPQSTFALIVQHSARIADLMEEKGCRRSAAINVMLRKHELTSDEANVLLDALVNNSADPDARNRKPLR